MEGCRMKSMWRVRSSYNKIYRKSYYYHVAIHSGVRFCSCKLPERHTGSRIQQDTKNLDSANAIKMWPKNHTELPNDTTHLLDIYYIQQWTISIVDCLYWHQKRAQTWSFWPHHGVHHDGMIMSWYSKYFLYKMRTPCTKYVGFLRYAISYGTTFGIKITQQIFVCSYWSIPRSKDLFKLYKYRLALFQIGKIYESMWTTEKWHLR